MNFNLISPSNNGYDYTTRFREDIVIKPNSKVYLNFGTLSQRVGVNLTEDQTIKITSQDLLPVYKPDDTTELNFLSKTVDVKKGSYTIKQFRDAISNALNSLVSLTDATKSSNQLGIYIAEDNDLNPNNNLGDDYISIGFKQNHQRIPLNELSLDATNILNFGVSAIDANDKYVKTDASTTDYSAYGMAQNKYFFYNLATPGESYGEEEGTFVCSQELQDFSAGEKCGFGLYSTEYMTIFTGGSIINGNNFEIIDGVPKCFIFFEITHTHFVVYIAEDTSGNLINDWTSINTEIGGMRGVYRLPLFEFLGYDETPAFDFSMYYDTSNDEWKDDERKLYFKVSDNNEGRVLFDSQQQGGYYFPYEFLFDGTAPTTADEVNANIPFKFLMSSNTQNVGFSQVIFGNFVETKLNTSDDFPNSIVQSYNLTFSEQLAEYFKITADTPTRELFPNVKDTVFWWADRDEFWSNVVLLSNLNLDFINSNYTVYLEELPTTNYKNTDTSQNGGYSQNILANLPVPFSNLIDNTNKDNQIITGLYQPNFQVISNMKNQAIRSNYFRVIIKRMEDDRPATELLRSVINFTIVQPEE